MADKQTWERKIIEAGYRDLAKRFHPDKGGAPETMAALNAAVINLRNVDKAAVRESMSFDEFSPQRRGARRETPPGPFEGLNEFADKVLEIIDKVSKPRGKRRG